MKNLCDTIRGRRVAAEERHSREPARDEPSVFATGPRTVGFTIVLGGRVVTMQMTRPKGSSAQWLPPAPPSTLRQLLACNVASGSSFGTGRGREWIAFVVAWLPYSLLTYRFWHNVDDAFISFRYAKNWAMGYGLRFNLEPQQPEEGYSNFLWVAVCAFVEYLKLDITFWAPMLGFACGSLLLYLVFRTLRRDFGMGLGVAFSITLGLGLFPPYALWSTGGLGTMAFALSTFATAYFLVLRPAGIAPYRGALAGVATALLRTEGIAWALLIALLGIVSRRMRGESVWRPVPVWSKYSNAKRVSSLHLPKAA